MPDDIRSLRETPSQTAGPYVHIGCMPTTCGVPDLFSVDLGAVNNTGLQAERVAVEGQIFDGAGEPLTDAMIEVWHADPDGSFSATPKRTEAPGIPTGWARQATDLSSGLYRFEVSRPGPVMLPDGTMQAPHLSFWIVARGINVGLNTRMYFPDDAANTANSACPVLSLVDAARRETLIAQQNGDAYRFDVHLQGENETVFFAI